MDEIIISLYIVFSHGTILLVGKFCVCLFLYVYVTVNLDQNHIIVRDPKTRYAQDAISGLGVSKRA